MPPFASSRLLRYMSSKPRQLGHPLITVLGATGTGKSELAVSLARRLNGEVINGDALQLYEGLPIVTNKINTAEQHGVRHHLLGTVPLAEVTWTAPQFKQEAVRLIDDIRARGKVPILAGGTHYYLQSLLFKDALVAKDERKNLGDELLADEGSLGQGNFMSVSEEERKWPILKGSPEDIRAELLRVDPMMADRWHPNDHRKIRRSLVIYLQTGQRASEIYAEQAQVREQFKKDIEHDNMPPELNQAAGYKSNSNSNLNYDNLLFWVYARSEALDTRLHTRVKSMVERGLLDEIKQMEEFRDSEQAQGHTIDDTRGVWVAIGYKEFTEYLQEIRKSLPEQDAAAIEAAIAQGEEKTVIATRQYARYQNKWMRTKFLPSLSAAGIRDRLFLLDSTDTNLYHSDVEDKAAEIATSWLSGKPLPDPSQLSPLAAEVLGRLETMFTKPERSQHVCELCGLTMMTDADWEVHVKSTKHKRAQKRIALSAANPRYAEAQARIHQNKKKKGKEYRRRV